MIDKEIQNKKQKYVEVKGKCRTCLGCNLLENPNFAGYYRCDNYARGEEDDDDIRNTNEVAKPQSIHKRM